MTRERALDLIQNIWGRRQIISKSIVDEVEANKIDGDKNDLETLARIAELPEVLKIPSFNSDMVYMLCSRVRAERDIEKSKRY